MPKSILVPVSVGELFDKITILEIKAERIRDASKLKNIELELRLLTDVVHSLLPLDASFTQLRHQLKAVNEAIWDAEDVIRDYDKRCLYGKEFIETSRIIYQNNDRRAEIKRQLNLLAGSTLVEEKSYQLPTP